MTKVQNNNTGLYTASAIALGGAAGATAGATLMPKLLRINSDAFLSEDKFAYASDKIARYAGSTSAYRFGEIASKAALPQGEITYCKQFFKDGAKEVKIGTIIEGFKDAMKEMSTTDPGYKTAESILKSLEDTGADKKITEEELKNIFAKNSDNFKEAESKLSDFVKKLPKGKFMAVCAAAGAAVLGLGVYIASKIISNNKNKAAEQQQ